MAQTGGNPNTKCGAETWSTDKMMYVDVPCVGAQSDQQGTIGAAAPSVSGTNSTTYTKAQMKQGTYYSQPMPAQAVSVGPSYASMGSSSCGRRTPSRSPTSSATSTTAAATVSADPVSADRVA